MTRSINSGSIVSEARDAFDAGDDARAESLLRKAAGAGEIGAHALLARLLHGNGMLEEAEKFARHALANDPADGLTSARLGAILLDRRAPQEAVEYFQAATAARPNLAELQNDLGNALAAADRVEEAEAALRTALLLNPNLAAIHNNLGNVLKQAGKPTAAIAAYRAALALEPTYAEAENNLAVTLQTIGDIEGALGHYGRVIELSPDFAAAHTHFGTAFAVQGRLAEAIAEHRRAIELAPELADAHNNLGIALKDHGALTEAVAAYRQALQLKPDDAGAHSNLLLCLCGDSEQDEASLFHQHLGWAAQHEGALAAPAIDFDGIAVDPNRLLRIGYLSPDFFNHSVAYFVEGVLANHDRRHIHVTCYSDGLTEDDMTDRLRKSADAWRRTAAFSDSVLAAQIRRDEIDILIDLAGHTADNRLPLFGQRLAPVQGSWIGYPATTGLSQMDYRLTDQQADPVGESVRWHSETLLRLPGSFLCYTPRPDCPAVAGDRREGPVTFGSFNNLSKVTPAVIASWSRLLEAVPSSQLLLKARQLADAAVREEMAGAFAKHGVAPERLQCHARMQSRTDHLQLYAEVDIALDTFPYCGATTTCEALWMGVPVITLAGSRHAGRVGVSLLSAAGLPEWIASSEDEYIAIAGDLVGDRPPRAELRQTVAKSKLADAERFTAAYEHALREVWRRWCDSVDV